MPLWPPNPICDGVGKYYDHEYKERCMMQYTMVEGFKTLSDQIADLNGVFKKTKVNKLLQRDSVLNAMEETEKEVKQNSSETDFLSRGVLELQSGILLSIPNQNRIGNDALRVDYVGILTCFGIFILSMGIGLVLGIFWQKKKGVAYREVKESQERERVLGLRVDGADRDVEVEKNGSMGDGVEKIDARGLV